MVPQNIRQQTYEFADFFYNGVIDRLKAAGAPDRDYKLPEIRFAPQRTADEERKNLMLSHELFTKTAKNEQFLLDDSKELGRLKQKVPYESAGFADNADNAIVLNQDHFSDAVDYSTLSHEILHIIRHQALLLEEINEGYSDLDRARTRLIYNSVQSNEKLVSPEVTEFFPQLEKLVISDICTPDSRYPSAGDELEYPTMERIRSSHKYFRKGPRRRLNDLLNSYYKLLENARAELVKTQKPDLSELKEFRDFRNHMKQWDSPKPYFYYVGHVNDAGLKSIQYIYETLDQEYRYTFEDENFLLERIEEAESSSSINWNKRKCIESLGHAFFSRVLSSSDQTRPYMIALLTIGENEDYLQKNWEKVLLMDGSKVENKLIRPIKQELQKMSTNFDRPDKYKKSFR